MKPRYGMVLSRGGYDVTIMLLSPRIAYGDGHVTWLGLILRCGGQGKDLWRAGDIESLGPTDNRGQVDERYWKVLP